MSETKEEINKDASKDPLRLTARPSPITSETVALSGVAFADLQCGDKDRLYFAVSDPLKQGKSCIQSLRHDSSIETHTDLEHNVRSAVHEYGGGAFVVSDVDGSLVYTDFPSHVVYYKTPGSAPVQVFPPKEVSRYDNCRLADFSFAYDNTDQASKAPTWLLAVMEDHTHPEPSQVVNSIVIVSLTGCSTVHVVATGHDFYASPTLSNRRNDGSYQLAYVAWDHPNMPWDDTGLFVQSIQLTTDSLSMQEEPVLVHGCGTQKSPSQPISVYAPQWYEDRLFALSDVTGWYNLYEWTQSREATKEWLQRALFPKDADFADAASGWKLGCKSFTILPASHTLVATYSYRDDSGAGSRIVLISLKDQNTAVQEFGSKDGLPSSIYSLVACGTALYFLGGSTTSPVGIWCWTQPGNVSCAATEILSSLQKQKEELISSITEFLSEPQLLKFPSAADKGGPGYAYGHYYPPNNLSPDLTESNFRPPLLVKAHGGPTSRTSTTFRLDIQFWTSRGFAVLDVDYAGSTGYGKDYRQSLQKLWGVLDVANVCDGALYCVKAGLAKADWLCIDGGSAGGYTTLAALTFEQVFCAGASKYGIGDLSSLAESTHKFESRYMDGLIAPYPAGKHIYDERCPIRFTEKLDCPVILLQGDQDKVVPPDQAEDMFRALCEKGLPASLVVYLGEQHGFRKADNIRHALLSEYYFFCQTFGLEPQPEGDFAGVALGKRSEV